MSRKPLNQVTVSPSPTATYVHSSFAENQLDVQALRAKLESATIIKVYYVYTRYKLSPTFDQKKLDTERFVKLESSFPLLLEDPLIEWDLIEQTGCKDFKEGDQYFHGFVIIHRPITTDNVNLEEISRLDAFLDGETEEFPEDKIDPIEELLSGQTSADKNSGASDKKTTTAQIKNERAEYVDGANALYRFFQKNMVNCDEVAYGRKDVWVDMDITIDENGKVGEIVYLKEYEDYIKKQIQETFDKMSSWNPATDGGKPVSSTVNMQLRVSYSGNVKGMYTRDHLRPDFTQELEEEPEEGSVELSVSSLPTMTKPLNITKTTVYKGLNTIDRNLKIALVMDVTGSMTSNIGAMQHWLGRNRVNPFTSFTFFNDGDGKPTAKKKVGSIGGIYQVKSREEVRETIKKAMMRGNGGERPENDVEALIYAQENDPDCDIILLIGDNYSEVRDLKLLDKVKKPVIVLPVSVPKWIRGDYLTIAYQTGGYLLFNGEKIEVTHVEKGQKFFIKKAEYKFDGSEFTLKP